MDETTAHNCTSMDKNCDDGIAGHYDDDDATTEFFRDVTAVNVVDVTTEFPADPEFTRKDSETTEEIAIKCTAMDKNCDDGIARHYEDSSEIPDATTEFFRDVTGVDVEATTEIMLDRGQFEDSASGSREEPEPRDEKFIRGRNIKSNSRQVSDEEIDD
jgi:hypothetical protein